MYVQYIGMYIYMYVVRVIILSTVCIHLTRSLNRFVLPGTLFCRSNLQFFHYFQFWLGNIYNILCAVVVGCSTGALECVLRVLCVLCLVFVVVVFLSIEGAQSAWCLPFTFFMSDDGDD